MSDTAEEMLEPEVVRNVALKFFRWWWNQEGADTGAGYDDWAKTPEGQAALARAVRTPIASPSGVGEVEAKPLEWESVEGSKSLVATAECVLGHYEIVVDGKERFHFVWLNGNMTRSERHNTEDEAKAAAQKHLNETVGSALEGSAAPGFAGGVEALALLEQFGKDLGHELSWGEITDEDAAECAWRVHVRSGNRNDRTWDLISTGSTPLEALRAALVPTPPTGGKL